MNKIIISDTSCLIALSRIEKLDISQKTFNTILTTPQVAEEFAQPLPPWIILKEISNHSRFKEIHLLLDEGEASAITLAIETKDSVLVIDEKKGRKIARELDLEIIGTLRILLLAKQKGIIPAVKPLIETLHQCNFRFSKSIVEEILKEANEV
jgi:predicted nucleic acid-binding protein